MKLTTIINIFLIILLVSVSISAIKAHRELVSLKQWQQDVSKRLAENEKRLLQLKNRLKLTGSKEYLLKLAREKLYMRRADETVIPLKGFSGDSTEKTKSRR